jgi:putative transposase
MNRRRKLLRRREVPGQARYLTFSTFQRLPLFQNDAIKDAFVEQLATIQRQLEFPLFAWVVMPEHVHLLLLPRPPRVTVTAILLPLKRGLAARVLARWRQLHAPILRAVADRAGEQHFWQAGGGYDRNVFADGELEEKVRYVHNNPVRRGLVATAVDWPWSSARWYAGLPYVGPTIARLSEV